MEPLFFKAENDDCWHGCRILHPRFNGAAFFQSGKSLDSTALLKSAVVASMEPLFFKAENPGQALPAPSPAPRFNGAAFFQSGKYCQRVTQRHKRTGFNGAAFFQSGK